MSARPAGRIASLDAFRGFAIASMVLVNNPGDWSHLHAPLAHAKWNGWTFTDTVFPFFLFAAGMSMAVSLDRRLHAGETRGKLMLAMAKRAAVIFLVGLLLNLFPKFDLATVRIPGVLQRIALCVLAAAPFAIYLRTRWIVAGIALLFALYSWLMLFVPVPGPDGVVAAGVLEPGRDFGAWLDRRLLGGHLWAQSRTWDPEGLASTLPAIASVLLAVIAGRWLLRRPVPVQAWWRLLAVAAASLWLGVLLNGVFMPINKSLWTPTYVVFMTGCSLAAFTAFHVAAELGPFTRALLKPLAIYGMNALFIFAFSGLVARLLALFDLKRVLYAPIQSLPIAPENASLLHAIAFDLAMFAVAWFLWKKRWFIRA